MTKKYLTEEEDSPYKTIMNAIHAKAKHKGYHIEYLY